MGYLAPDGAGGALLENEFGQTRVRWPDGYKVVVDPVRLYGPFGSLIATEGDAVYVGGGMSQPDEEVFVACDYVSTDPPGQLSPLPPKSAAPR